MYQRLLSSPFRPVRGIRFGARAFSAAPATAAQPKPFESIPGPPVDPKVGGTSMHLMQTFQKLGPYHGPISYHKEFGPLVKQVHLGVPMVWLYDPVEGMRVFQNEGRYPNGGAANLWMLQNYAEERGVRWSPLFSAGPEWKKTRSIFQKDMFPRQAAESYLPFFNVTTRNSVQFVDKVKTFDQLAPYAAFDLFSSFMFGTAPSSVSGLVDASKVSAEDMAFARNAISATSNMLLLSMDQTLKGQVKHPLYVAFAEAFDHVTAHARRLIEKEVEKAKALRASLMEDAKDAQLASGSYLSRVIARGEANEEDALTELSFFLFAGVDTTTHVLQWLVLHLGQNPDKQEVLRKEVLRVLGKDGDVTAESLQEMEYLNACMTESHRLTPPLSVGMVRNIVNDMTLHGYHIPAGTQVAICTLSVQRDPSLVDEPERFIPERFMPAEIEKRKGSPKEILDNPLMKRPFSFGARMCLGARIAEVEIKTFLAHLVRRFAFEMEPKDQQYVPLAGGLIRPHPFPTLKYTPVK